MVSEERALNATALHEHRRNTDMWGACASVQHFSSSGSGSGPCAASGGDAAGGTSQATGRTTPRMRVGGRQGVYGFALRLRLAEERGGVVGAEGHAVVVVGSRAGVFAGEGGAATVRIDNEVGAGSLGGCDPAEPGRGLFGSEGGAVAGGGCGDRGAAGGPPADVAGACGDRGGGRGPGAPAARRGPGAAGAGEKGSGAGGPQRGEK